MIDPYRFILAESVVSSSQEDILKHTPGWDEKHPLSPSSQHLQLGLWRLCGSGGDSEGDDDGGGRKRDGEATTFCVQEPMVWASPDTQLEKAGGEEDSYNPAFESDRSRSLSPHRPWDLFGDLFSSRIITQSQTGAENAVSKCVMGMAHLEELGGDDLLLGDESSKKKKEEEANRSLLVVDKCDVPPPPAAGVGLDRGIVPSLSTREHGAVHHHGQEQDPKPPALEDTDSHLNQFVVDPSISVETSSAIMSALQPNTYCVEHKKHTCRAEVLAGHGCPQSSTEENPTFKARIAEQLAFIFNQTLNKNVISDAVHDLQAKHCISVQMRPEEPSGEEALVRPKISSATVNVEKLRKRTAGKGALDSALSTQKLKAFKLANGEQEHSKLASEAKQWREKEVKQFQLNNWAEGARVRDSEAKDSLSSGKSVGIEHKSLASRMEKTDRAETVSGHSVDDKALRLFPDSLMDVVIQVSGSLPPPRPEDPDFLSLVMRTGVSLPLPFRDCNGRFIGNKST